MPCARCGVTLDRDADQVPSQMIGGAGLGARWRRSAISARSQGAHPAGLVVLLFHSPFELPHCLSVALQNINWRALADFRRHQDFAVHPLFICRESIDPATILSWA
jgi:hypothetical protein